jgi:hypothetical protein
MRHKIANSCGCVNWCLLNALRSYREAEVRLAEHSELRRALRLGLKGLKDLIQQGTVESTLTMSKIVQELIQAISP